MNAIPLNRVPPRYSPHEAPSRLGSKPLAGSRMLLLLFNLSTFETMPTTNLLRVTCLVLLSGCAHSNLNVNRPAPATGVELLQRMRDDYAGKWPRIITFVQKTTITRPTGVVDTSTWYEALKSPDRLRIDFGDPSKGNGALYTADSLYVVRGGKITRTVGSGNPFLPFVAGVYDQPIATTLQQIAPYHFDLTRIRSDTWQGRPVYVVGATSPTDLDSPQFWIDRDRLIAVRFLVKLSPAPDAKPNDIRLEKYVPIGAGWLATHVAIMDGGVVRQAEDYTDWKGDMALSNDFFVAEKWSDVPHWFRGK